MQFLPYYTIFQLNMEKRTYIKYLLNKSKWPKEDWVSPIPNFGNGFRWKPVDIHPRNIFKADSLTVSALYG